MNTALALCASAVFASVLITGWLTKRLTIKE